jgi:hypothetical protein
MFYLKISEERSVEDRKEGLLCRYHAVSSKEKAFTKKIAAAKQKKNEPRGRC